MMKKDTVIWINIENKQEVELSEKLQLRMTISKDVGDIIKVTALFNRYGERPSIIKQMKRIKEEGISIEYSTTVKFDSYGKYFFFFVLDVEDVDNLGTQAKRKAVKINRQTGKPYITKEKVESPYWIISVIPDGSKVPNWAKDKIFYQLVVDRFYRSNSGVSHSKQKERNYRQWGDFPNWKRNNYGDFHNNDFFCGDIKGIEEKLDYLKSLNVGVIYMSPINESGLRYERYASTNHSKIDPDAGTFEDLKSLHEKANAMGMYLILDVAFNHCSSDNPIFQEALNNPDSRYRNWFFFDSNGKYRYWYNEFRDMPVFNQNNLEVQDYIYGENGIVDKFSDYVDGFRLDVAEELQPFFLEGIRNRANQRSKHLIIGECWNKVNPDILGKSLDSKTNYLYSNAIYKYIIFGEYEYFVWQIYDLLNSYPIGTIDTMVNSLDTHDIVRSLTILGGKFQRTGYDKIWEIDKDPSPWHINTAEGRRFLTDEFRQFEYENDKLSGERYEYAKKLLKIAVIIQYFLPGNPCIFYGTEVGAHGYKDPFNRKCFPWDNMDEELLDFYRKIGEFRSHYKGANSEFKVTEANQQVLIFERWNSQNSVMIAINRTDREVKINLPRYFESSETFCLNSSITKRTLGPYGGIIFLK